MAANFDPNQEREFILRDCADRLANLGEGPISADQMGAIMLDRLAKDASDEIVECARLGKVIKNLNRDLAVEMTPKGVYGLGKVFRAGFENVGRATGRKMGTEAEIDAATNVLLDKFLGKVYEIAEVNR
jgi:hypothetical protein